MDHNSKQSSDQQCDEDLRRQTNFLLCSFLSCLVLKKPCTEPTEYRTPYIIPITTRTDNTNIPTSPTYGSKIKAKRIPAAIIKIKCMIQPPRTTSEKVCFTIWGVPFILMYLATAEPPRARTRFLLPGEFRSSSSRGFVAFDLYYYIYIMSRRFRKKFPNPPQNT